MRRREYKAGEKFGVLTFIEEVDPRYTLTSKGYRQTIRRAIFECKCGNKFESDIRNVKSGNTQSCGCVGSKKTIERNIKFGETGELRKHGMSFDPIYQVWMGMKRRCYDKKNVRYKYYGGKGIIVCKEWMDDFMAFYNYVSKLDHFGENGYTLDRVDNDGNYEPGNVRWATYQMQAINRGIQRNNRTGYTGVSIDSRSGKYMSSVTVMGKVKNLGLYDTPEEAVSVRNEYIESKRLLLSQQNIKTKRPYKQVKNKRDE